MNRPMDDPKDRYYYFGGLDEQGQADPKLQPPLEFYDPQGRRYDPYLPSPELREAVNLAIALKRPLLLEGEPGCGKTRLAGMIAYEFTQRHLKGQKDENGKEKWWSYYIWDVKSYGRARDGLYRFDAVARLRDAQLAGMLSQRVAESLDSEKAEAFIKESNDLLDRLNNKERYVEYGPLGEALKSEVERPIVLIDEIDKADSDFPNDLLGELDRLSFTVEETKEKYPKEITKVNPIIIITSNRERPLPEPFLRRCLYFYVKFPNDDELKKIIQGRLGQKMAGKDKLVDSAIAKFADIRKILKGQPGSKLPGTSEILEFLDSVTQSEKDPQQVIDQLETQLPFLGILLKTRRDQQLYRKEKGMTDDE
jgi:MoxR-like ATPase